VGVGAQLRHVGAVTLDQAALDVLAEQPDDCDGHFDGTYVWVGGSEYPVTR
jgi:hypothetical protein